MEPVSFDLDGEVALVTGATRDETEPSGEIVGRHPLLGGKQ